MKFELLSAGDLTAAHFDAWAAIRCANSELDNPHFHPDFTRAVANVFDNVQVLVISRGGGFVGLLPLQCQTPGNASPVGLIMSDVHGLIAAADAEFDAMQMLREVGLKSFAFNHMLASQATFAPHQKIIEDFSILDLAEGFDAYAESRRAVGSSMVKQAQRKARKLEREVGPLRLEWHTSDDADLNTLIQWKRGQLAAAGLVDVYAESWSVQLLAETLKKQSESFRGVLSALYAGSELVALQLGLAGKDVVTVWVPAYSPDHMKYSTGLILQVKLIEKAAELGIKRIDLGHGGSQLQLSLRTGAYPIAMGCVDRRPLRRMMNNAWYRARRMAHSGVLGGVPLRAYRRLKSKR